MTDKPDREFSGIEQGTARLPVPRNHASHRLSDVRIRQLTKPGRYMDGGGLMLMVKPSGAKSWVLRLVIRDAATGVRARRDIGLGSVNEVKLAEVRETARQYREAARLGKDPLAIERAKKTPPKIAPTFMHVAKQVHAARAAEGLSAKHHAVWLSSLEAYAFPVIGDMAVDKIERKHCLQVLAPIWNTKAETARRVRQRMGTIFDWAKAHGLRDGDSPMSAIEQGLPKQTDDVTHMAALPFADVAAFVRALRASGATPSTKWCLEFLILTAARPGEARGALKAEFDLSSKVRKIPGSRMKSGKEHIVPLSPRVLEIIDEAKAAYPEHPLLFPSATGREISDVTLGKLARTLGFGHLTAHGFRSTFRDWVGECTTFQNEVAEQALAHAIEDRTEAAYRRGGMLEKRRLMMNAWAEYVTAEPGSNVVALNTARTA